MRPDLAFTALRFDPLIDPLLVGAVGALAVVLVGLGLWRRAGGTWLRAASFAVLVAWLAGPRLVQESRHNLNDIALLVVDQSASMGIGDRAALAEAARARIAEQAARFPDLELRTVVVPESGNTGTNLFAGIERALTDIPRARHAGTIVITDGQIHDPPAASPGAGPLHLLIPARREETDRRLRIIEAPGYGIVGKPVTLRVVIEDLGSTATNATATLTVRRDGEPPRVESVPVGRERQIEIPIERAGPTVVELAASPLEGEISRLNNRQVIEINGVRDRLRVLLISGEPHPGERIWRRLLKADPSVDLVHFTILRPPEKDDLTPLNELALIAFPVRELFQDKIGEFDLIILDRFQNRGLLPLPYMANIANRVRRGGALLLVVGPEYSGPGSLAATPLAQVLPAAPVRMNAVVEGRFLPQISDLGQRHPVTERLAGSNPLPAPPSMAETPPTWGPWYRRVQPLQTRGDVLMQTPDGAPLLALDRVGQGRAALLLSDQIWLWSRGHEGGGPQAELLRRIAHWLMREPELEENALTARVSEGRLMIERRSTDPAAATAVTVTDPDGATQTLPLRPAASGRMQASLPAPMPGVWQVTDGTLNAFAAAGAANPMELADLRATATVLNRLVRASAGGTQWLAADLPDLRRVEPGRIMSGGSWIGLERRHDHVVIGVSALALLPGWASLPLMLALLVLAWRREGR
jgi:hypothetical protein